MSWNNSPMYGDITEWTEQQAYCITLERTIAAMSAENERLRRLIQNERERARRNGQYLASPTRIHLD